MNKQPEVGKPGLLQRKIRLQLEVTDEEYLRHHSPAYRSGLPVTTGTIIRRTHITPRGWPHWMYVVELDRPLMLDYENVHRKAKGQTAQYLLLEPGLTTDTLPDDKYEEYLIRQGLIVGSLWLVHNPQDVPSEMSKADFDRFSSVSDVKATILSVEGAKG